MSKCFIEGMGGGGGAGGTLVVTAPVSVAVTAEKDGKKYTRTANSDGIAKFKGLATGIWAITMTDGNITTTPKTVAITADYAVELAFFAATITVTYPANSTCTCSDGTTTFTDTNTETSAKTVTFTVPNTGTWTVTSTNGTITKNQSFSITKEGQSESVELMYRTYLYDNGTQHESLTVDKGTGSTVSLNTNGSIIVTVNNSGSYMEHAVRTTNMIDLSKFTKLCAIGANTNYRSVSYQKEHIGIGKEVPAWNLPHHEKIAAYVLYPVSSTTSQITLDLSAVSGDYYVFLTRGRDGSKVDSVWLE